MIKRSGSLAYRKDANSRVIPSGTSIRDITNTTIKDNTWEVISVPAGINCKSVLIVTRGNVVWKISHLVAGTRYLTVRAPLMIDIAGIPLEVLFYAQSDSGDQVLEVLFLD
jgi:hypothetical protein